MKNVLTFRGGMAGAFAPFAFFLAGVVWLALSGAPDERGFWPVLLAALGLGLLLARDRSRYSDAVLESMSDPIVALMIMAWMLAGVLGVILNASGMVQSLVWLAQSANLSGGLYIGAAYLVCAIVSTATGTSFGTILLAGPLLYPAGGPLGTHPVVLMGAILAGATWGDSISPVSDTTIASAGSQNTDIGGTVRSRLKYVIPAGMAALLASVALGTTFQQAPTGNPSLIEGSAQALPMLVVPVLVIALLIGKRHLLEGLFAGIALACVLGMTLGLVGPDRLFYIDRAAFGARGLIIDGMGRAVGVSIFTLLLMGLVGTLRASGILESITSRLQDKARSVRATEGWIVATVSVAVLLTTHSVVAMLAVGPLVMQLGERAGIHAYRRANLLDMTVCTYPFLLPYFLPTILASSASASAVEFGMRRVSPFEVGMANTYSWALVVAVVLAVTTGFGRGDGKAAD